jgi:hypothetical protein
MNKVAVSIVTLCFILILAIVVLIVTQQQKVSQSPTQIALEVCSNCGDDTWPARIVLVRGDGIVIIGMAGSRGESLRVIDTKNKKVTDETGIEPHLVYGEVVVTAGFSENMSELRILRSNSTKFELLASSTLPIGETYDTGLRQEFGVEWNASTTAGKMIIDIYEPDFVNVIKNGGFKKLYQKEITL